MIYTPGNGDKLNGIDSGEHLNLHCYTDWFLLGQLNELARHLYAENSLNWSSLFILSIVGKK